MYIFSVSCSLGPKVDVLFAPCEQCMSHLCNVMFCYVDQLPSVFCISLYVYSQHFKWRRPFFHFFTPADGEEAASKLSWGISDIALDWHMTPNCGSIGSWVRSSNFNSFISSGLMFVNWGKNWNQEGWHIRFWGLLFGQNMFLWPESVSRLYKALYLWAACNYFRFCHSGLVTPVIRYT